MDRGFFYIFADKIGTQRDEHGNEVLCVTATERIRINSGGARKQGRMRAESGGRNQTEKKTANTTRATNNPARTCKRRRAPRARKDTSRHERRCANKRRSKQANKQTRREEERKQASRRMRNTSEHDNHVQASMNARPRPQTIVANRCSNRRWSERAEGRVSLWLAGLRQHRRYKQTFEFEGGAFRQSSRTRARSKDCKAQPETQKTKETNRRTKN